MNATATAPALTAEELLVEIRDVAHGLWADANAVDFTDPHADSVTTWGLRVENVDHLPVDCAAKLRPALPHHIERELKFELVELLGQLDLTGYDLIGAGMADDPADGPDLVDVVRVYL
ncbi:hypothetical protein [Streptomyces alboflavus]|uniref:hypothetical protein n=1 Tax=Streptomyces alboflavus TaxID=67267 RepID=UPI0036993091